MRLFRTKLLLPMQEGFFERPRLAAIPRARVLVVQAPAGAGKSVFVGQWLQAQGLPVVYYALDEQDRDGAVFAAHVLAGLQAVWPDWAPPPGAWAAPAALAVELVNEAAGRPPLALALDGLEAAFGQPYLADFLAVVARYAPPGLTLVLATRAPLPAEITAPGRPVRVVPAEELAFTPEEAAVWLGDGPAHHCHAATGGLPMGLALWQHEGEGWRAALAAHLVAQMPPHVPSEVGRALVEEWLAGRLSLAAFAYQVSRGQPGAERLVTEVQEIRSELLLGRIDEAADRLGPLWETVRSGGNRFLAGAVALLRGEVHYCKGEYARAIDWYRQAFEHDPLLETVGTHSLIAIYKDLGQLDDAEGLAKRCIEARLSRGDLQALAYAHGQFAAVLVERGRLDEAEAEYLEAERLGLKLSGEPFYGILAMAQRAVLHRIRGNHAENRRVAEEAYAMARRRSPWLEAICGYILAPALLHWGETEQAIRLLRGSLGFLSAIDSKWQLHMLYALMSIATWQRGDREQARQQMDRSLGLAAAEGYVQYLSGRDIGQLPLLMDALVRGVAVPFCQELLLRMGARALPALLELAASPEAEARRAALYPLARIGGEQATTALRHLLYDTDERVRDGAMMAMRSVGGVAPVPADHVPLKVTLLGTTEVVVAGERVQSWRTSKARDLIVYLLLSGDRPVTRDQLVEALWPETDLEGGQALLHTTLYYLRRTLKAAGEGLITFAGGAYRVDQERVLVDLDQFHRLAAASDEASWQEAVTLYRGDLLDGLDYPWVAPSRSRARAAYLEVLRRLAGTARSAGRTAQAVEWLQRLVQADPLAEDGHVALMECYAAAGNRAAALQQYRTLAHLLDEELGLEPNKKAQDLYRRLLD